MSIGQQDHVIWHRWTSVLAVMWKFNSSKIIHNWFLSVEIIVSLVRLNFFTKEWISVELQQQEVSIWQISVFVHKFITDSSITNKNILKMNAKYVFFLIALDSAWNFFRWIPALLSGFKCTVCTSFYLCLDTVWTHSTHLLFFFEWMEEFKSFFVNISRIKDLVIGPWKKILLRYYCEHFRELSNEYIIRKFAVNDK